VGRGQTGLTKKRGAYPAGLRAPIDLEVRDEGPYCVVEYEPLGLQGRGRDQDAALESFADQFRGMWEWIASADDPKLTQDARQLKRRMRGLVRSVTPAA
jgi:hypothetical protein